jgi:hypothetical protein
LKGKMQCGGERKPSGLLFGLTSASSVELRVEDKFLFRPRTLFPSSIHPIARANAESIARNSGFHNREIERNLFRRSPISGIG